MENEVKKEPGDTGTWSASPTGEMVRGTDRDTLGGSALIGGFSDKKYVFCGCCSPEPLNYGTAVIMRVRVIGWPMTTNRGVFHVDILECPVCGVQILR